MRKHSIVLVFLICAALGSARAQAPKLEPGDPNAEVPTMTFTQSWPDGIPPYYSISVDSAGRAAYHSTEKADNVGDPYDLKFVMSEENRTKLFDLAREAHYFRGDFDWKKTRVAFTGTKTLTFKNGEKQERTSYNWSDNVAVQQITKLFQEISETIELGRKLADTYRFDKLGVDAVLKNLESAAKDNRIAEVQAIQPILAKIAKDSSMMNISRRRAEFLLTKVPKNAQAGGQP